MLNKNAHSETGSFRKILKPESNGNKWETSGNNWESVETVETRERVNTDENKMLTGCLKSISFIFSHCFKNKGSCKSFMHMKISMVGATQKICSNLKHIVILNQKSCFQLISHSLHQVMALTRHRQKTFFAFCATKNV